jgi:Tfp pilus assembly protein PilN
LESEEEQKVAEALTGVLTDLTNEIVNTLNFYKAQYDAEMDFRQVLISGGVSKIENIDKFFENSLSIPAEKVDYCNFLNFHPDVDIRPNELLGASIGLALRGMGRSALNINLLPSEQLQIKKFRQKKPFIICSCILAFFTLLSYNQFVLNRYFLNRDYLKLLKSMKIKYQQVQKPLEQLSAEISGYEDKLNTITRVFTRKFSVIRAVDAIARALPESVWMESLTIDLDNNSLLLQGKCQANLNEIGLFRKSLQEKVFFKDVRIETIGKDKGNQITFSFKIVLDKEKI